MTSFQINLLRDDERSSDSSLSRRSLLRIALPVFPFILLVVIGSLFLSSRKKSNAYNEILLANQSLKSRIARYTKPAAHSRKHRELADELTEWRDLQPAVANWLQELRTNIPPTIQIQGLSVGLALVQPPKQPRQTKVTINMDCKASPESTEDEIRDFITLLGTSDHLVAAKQTDYDEKTHADGTPGQRSFKVECEMKPRSIQ